MAGVHVQRGATVCTGVEAIRCRTWHPVAGVGLGGKHSREPPFQGVCGPENSCGKFFQS